MIGSKNVEYSLGILKIHYLELDTYFKYRNKNDEQLIMRNLIKITHVLNLFVRPPQVRIGTWLVNEASG